MSAKLWEQRTQKTKNLNSPQSQSFEGRPETGVVAEGKPVPQKDPFRQQARGKKSHLSLQSDTGHRKGPSGNSTQ